VFFLRKGVRRSRVAVPRSVRMSALPEPETGSLSPGGENGNHFMCLRDCSFSKQISSINSASTTMRCFNVTVHGFV